MLEQKPSPSGRNSEIKTNDSDHQNIYNELGDETQMHDDYEVSHQSHKQGT